MRRPHVIHGDPDGDFFFAVAAPDPRLRGLVARYGDYHERTDAPLRRLEVPRGEIPVIVDFGDGWLVGQGETPLTRLGSFAGGLHDGPAVAEHGGRARCMQIDLHPLGARMLLGVPPGELAHQVIALEDLLGARRAAPRGRCSTPRGLAGPLRPPRPHPPAPPRRRDRRLRPDVAYAQLAASPRPPARMPIERLRRELAAAAATSARAFARRSA